ncbi:MAG: hypothetical protein K0Q71_4485, partial [Thermomicrobiales bacterium]|nr:hypothetical protein [Thermomicrobiales bacterium]
MASDWSSFVSREELLGGLPARRASTLLFAIESRTAHLMARSRQAMATFLTEKTAEERERAFMEALAQGRDPPLQPTIQDLERYAPEWADLVPPDAGIRATVGRMIGDKYTVPYRQTSALRTALGLDDAAVKDAYQRLHGQPLDSLFARRLPWRERLHWVRSQLAHRLETLPPFWTAFALTLTETVGAGILALPIVFAGVGPLAGVGVLVLLGLVNILTIGAIAEAVARNGNVRYGRAYFGRLVADYLGRPGTLILTPALFTLNVVTLLAYYVGLSASLDDSTGMPQPVWVALLFVVGLAVLRRGTLDATVASALVVGALSIGLIVLLSLLALPHVSAAHLQHAEVPLVGGEPFDTAILELVFGVVLLAFFGHTSSANCAAVVLRRDPSARTLIQGSMAALAAALALYCLWIVAVNGAVGPAELADQSGTALEPLAAEVGSSVHIVGSLFVILAMGMASIHNLLGLFNQVREWLPVLHDPTPTDGSLGNGERAGGLWGLRRWTSGQRAGFILGMAPGAAIFVLVEGLILTDRESFAAPLGFLGVLTASIFSGIFAMLMLVAARRKGDCEVGMAWRFLGHPAIVASIYALFLTGILVHGLVIWQAPYERLAAVLVAAAVVAVTVLSVLQGAFTPRAVVELRVDPDGAEPAVVNVTARGHRTPFDLRWSDDNGWRTAGQHSAIIELPAASVRELKVWVHRLTPDGSSEHLP